MARYDSTRVLAGELMVKLRNNAKRRNIPVEITVDDIDRLIREQRYLCAVSGIRFDDSPREDGGRVRPFRPSVDRIDSNEPYRIGNVRMVCAAVNAALGDWGDDILRQYILSDAKYILSTF